MNIVHYNQEIPNPSMHKLPIRKRESFRKRDASLLVWKEMVMASTFLLHLVVVYGYRSENMPQFLFFFSPQRPNFKLHYATGTSAFLVYGTDPL